MAQLGGLICNEGPVVVGPFGDSFHQSSQLISKLDIFVPLFSLVLFDEGEGFLLLCQLNQVLQLFPGQDQVIILSLVTELDKFGVGETVNLPDRKTALHLLQLGVDLLKGGI
eukprot:sb/3477108/